MLGLTPLESEAVLLSLRVAFWSMLVSLPVAIAVAWLLARGRFPGLALVNGLVHLPLVMPPVVIGYLLLLLLGRNGPMGAWLYDWFGVTVAFTWRGAAVAAAVMAFPLMVRAIRLSLETVDIRLEAAARTLGAPPIWVFATVTLPLMLPGIVTGAMLAFARGFGEFGATITFVSNIPGETRTLPIALYGLTQVPGGEGGALRLMILSIVIAMLALFASELLARRVRARLEG
jgi:molybdate transport system permease protein